MGIDRKYGTEAEDIEQYLTDDVDGVFHLAAQTSVFNTDVHQIERDNIRTFITVCDACARKGKKLVYASSSTADPANMTSMYGMSKHFNEMYACVYNKRATGVRLHNVYGPDQRKGTLLWILQQGGTVRLYNNGENIRCFTYIDDAVDGLLYAFGSSEPLVNVAYPTPISTLDFARLAQQYLDFNIEIVPGPKKFDNSAQSVNKTFFCVSLSYTAPADGLRKIFG